MTGKEFISLLPRLRAVARNLGYAITTHGSLERDFDIVAIAWVEGAADPEEVAIAIKEAAGGVRWRCGWEFGMKPFGRMVFTFDWDKDNFSNNGYCDLSVMPPSGWVMDQVKMKEG